MNTETINQKEKELIAVASAVSAGCQRCCEFHFNKAFEVGANQEEVNKAVEEAKNTIHHADEMMLRKAYTLMDIPRQDLPVEIAASDCLTALVKLGAAVASNCTPTIKAHLDIAKLSGASEQELHMVIKLAKMILGKGSEFADQAINDALANLQG